jgi:hypothetical protein
MTNQCLRGTQDLVKTIVALPVLFIGNATEHSKDVTDAMPAYKINLTGQKFGRLIVVEEAEPRYFKSHPTWAVPYWKCVCECSPNIIREAQGRSLLSGRIKSCGCYSRDIQRERMTKHGAFESQTYSSWKHMKARCTNPNHQSYPNYGGRGITICLPWLLSFEVFLEDMGECPLGKTIDRHPDKDGNYEPGNCRWGTKREQDRNRRTNRVVTVNGFTGCIIEVCEHFGVSVKLYYSRVRRGWSIEKAITFQKSGSGE